MSIRLSSKALKKIVAGSVTAAFFFTTVGEPFAQTSFWADRQTARSRTSPTVGQGDARQLLSTISWPKESLHPILGSYRLPSNLGTVVETHTGNPGAPVLLHVQDAHGLYGAQFNASNVLDGLSHAGWSGVDPMPVYQEGGAAPANIDWLSAFPFDDIKERVAHAHLRLGELTGEEYRAIVAPSRTFRLLGVETKELYLKNLAARHETAKARAAADTYIEGIQARLAAIKATVYPPALLRLDESFQAYARQKIAFVDYVQSLAPLAPSAFRDGNYPNLDALVRLTALESTLNARALAEERELLVRKMGDHLSADAVKDLVAQALAVREGRLSQREFFQTLLSLSDQLKRQGVDMPTRELRNYVGYLKFSESLRHDALLTEADHLRARLLERFSKDDSLWRLVTMDRRVALERLLWKQEMTPDQYAAFKEEGALDWAEVEKYVAAQEDKLKFNSPQGKTPPSSESLSWANALPQVRAFYELAVERDAALVKNALADMERTGAKRGVLIAGGFHTPGLTRLFRDYGVSYAVIQPGFETGQTHSSADELIISKSPDAFSHSVREANLAVFNPAVPQSLEKELTVRLQAEFSLQAYIDKLFAGLSKEDYDRHLALLQSNKALLKAQGVPLEINRVLSIKDTKGEPQVVIFGQYNGEIFVVAGSLGAQSATQWIRETNLDQSEAVNLNKKLAGLLESQGFGGVWQQFWANLTKIRSLSPNSLNGTELSQLRSAALSAIQNIPDQLSQPITAPAKEGQRLVNQMQSAMPVVTQRAHVAAKTAISRWSGSLPGRAQWVLGVVLSVFAPLAMGMETVGMATAAVSVFTPLVGAWFVGALGIVGVSSWLRYRSVLPFTGAGVVPRISLSLPAPTPPGIPAETSNSIQLNEARAPPTGAVFWMPLLLSGALYMGLYYFGLPSLIDGVNMFAGEVAASSWPMLAIPLKVGVFVAGFFSGVSLLLTGIAVGGRLAASGSLNQIPVFEKLLVALRPRVDAFKDQPFIKYVSSRLEAQRLFVQKTGETSRFSHWTLKSASFLFHLPIHLWNTMYNFAFVKADRLFQIHLGIEVKGPLSFTEERFVAMGEWLGAHGVRASFRSVAMLLALPLLATIGLLASRLKLLAFSTIGQTGLLFILSGVITLMAPLVGFDPMSVLSLMVNANLVDVVMGSGWAFSAGQTGEITHALIQFVSPFAIASSLTLATLMNIFETSKALHRSANKDMGNGGRGFVRKWFGWILFLPGMPRARAMRQSGVKAYWTGDFWRGVGKSGLGLQTVGIEVAAFMGAARWLGGPVMEVVTRIENPHGLSVLSASQHLMGSLGVDTQNMNVWGVNRSVREIHEYQTLKWNLSFWDDQVRELRRARADASEAEAARLNLKLIEAQNSYSVIADLLKKIEIQIGAKSSEPFLKKMTDWATGVVGAFIPSANAQESLPAGVFVATPGGDIVSAPEKKKEETPSFPEERTSAVPFAEALDSIEKSIPLQVKQGEVDKGRLYLKILEKYFTVDLNLVAQQALKKGVSSEQMAVDPGFRAELVLQVGKFSDMKTARTSHFWANKQFDLALRIERLQTILKAADLTHDVEYLDTLIVAHLKQRETLAAFVENLASNQVPSGVEHPATMENARQQLAMLDDKISALRRSRWDQGFELAHLLGSEVDPGKIVIRFGENSSPEEWEKSLRGAGVEELSNLRVQMASARVEQARAAIPDQYRNEVTLTAVFNLLSLIGTKGLENAIFGPKILVQALAVAGVRDIERDHQGFAAIWNFARAVAQAEDVRNREVAEMDKIAITLRASNDRARAARSSSEKMALRMARVLDESQSGERAGGDYLNLTARFLEAKTQEIRAQREERRQLRNKVTVSAPHAPVQLTPEERSASQPSGVEDVIGAVLQFPGSLFKMSQRDTDLEKAAALETFLSSKDFTPFKFENPGVKDLYALVSERNPLIRQADAFGKEAREQLKAQMEADSVKFGVFFKVEAAGENLKGLKLQSSVGFQGSWQYDFAKGLKLMEKQLGIRQADLVGDDIRQQSLARISTLLTQLDNAQKRIPQLDRELKNLNKKLLTSIGYEVYGRDQEVQKAQLIHAIDQRRDEKADALTLIKTTERDLRTLVVATDKDRLHFTDRFSTKQLQQELELIRFERLASPAVDGKMALTAEGRETLGQVEEALQHARSLVLELADHPEATSNDKALLEKFQNTLNEMDASLSVVETHPQKSLSDLSERAVALTFLLASMQGSLTFKTEAGMKLFVLTEAMDKDLQGQLDPRISQRLALKSAQASLVRAVIAGETDPLRINVDFLTLFSSGQDTGGRSVGKMFGTNVVSVQFPREWIARIFSPVHQLFNSMADPAQRETGLTGILRDIIPGLRFRDQQKALKDSHLAEAFREIFTADQRDKELTNLRSATIGYYTKSLEVLRILQSQLKDVPPMGIFPSLGEEIVNAQSQGAEMEILRQIQSVNADIAQLETALISLGLDPRSLPQNGNGKEKITLTVSAGREHAGKSFEVLFGRYQQDLMRARERYIEAVGRTGRLSVEASLQGSTPVLRATLLDTESSYGPSISAAKLRTEAQKHDLQAAEQSQVLRIQAQLNDLALSVREESKWRALARKLRADLFAITRMGQKGDIDALAVQGKIREYDRLAEQARGGAIAATKDLLSTIHRDHTDLIVEPLWSIAEMKKGLTSAFIGTEAPSGRPSADKNPQFLKAEALAGAVRREDEDILKKFVRALVVEFAPTEDRLLRGTLSLRLVGGGRSEWTDIREIEARIQTSLGEEAKKNARAYLRKYLRDLKVATEAMDKSDNEIRELTNPTVHNDLLRRYKENRVQVGEVLSRYDRIATLQAERSYNLMNAALQYEALAQILKGYGVEMPTLRDRLSEQGAPTDAKGSVDALLEDIFATAPGDVSPAIPVPLSEWTAALQRKAPVARGPPLPKGEPAPLRLYSKAPSLAAGGKDVDIPVDHLSYKGSPEWKGAVVRMLNNSGIGATNAHVLNGDDWVSYVEAILRQSSAPEDLSRDIKIFTTYFPLVFKAFRDLGVPETMPNFLSLAIDPVRNRLFPHYATLMADPQIGYPAFRNMEKILGLTLLYVSELRHEKERGAIPEGSEEAWFQSRLTRDVELIQLRNREARAQPHTVAEHNELLNGLKDMAERLSLNALASIPVEERKAYRNAIRISLNRHLPSLGAINAIKNNGGYERFSQWGDLSTEALYSALTVQAYNMGFAPGDVDSFIDVMDGSFFSQVRRMTQTLGLRELSQLPDAARLRGINEQYHAAQEKWAGSQDPEEKARMEEDVRALHSLLQIEVKLEKEKLVLSTALYWLGEFSRQWGVKDLRQLKDHRGRFETSFRDYADRVMALRAMPEMGAILRRQGVTVAGPINWLSTDVQGVLTAFIMDWKREGWTEKEMKAHLGRVDFVSTNLREKVRSFSRVMGIPARSETGDALERLQANGEIIAFTRTLENVLRLRVEKKQMTFESMTGKDLESVIDELAMIHRAAGKFGVRLEAGEAQYFYEFLNDLREEMPFERRGLATHELEIESFFSDYAVARDVPPEAGRALARELEGGTGWPEWMGADERTLLLHFLTGKSVTLSNGVVEKRRDDALYDRLVPASESIYMASQWMRLRGLDSAEVKRETKDRLFMLAAHMAYSYLYGGQKTPEELARGDLSAFENLIRSRVWSRAEIARFFRFDALAKQLEIKNADELPGLPQWSPAQRFGFSVRLVERHEGEPELRSWFADLGKIQKAAKDKLGAYLAPEVADALVIPFRREAAQMNDYLEQYAIRRFSTTGREDLFTLNADAPWNLRRRILLVSLATESEVLDRERTESRYAQWTDLADRLASSGRSAGEISAAQHQHAELLSQLKEVFADLVLPDLAKRDPKANLAEMIRGVLLDIETAASPLISRFLAGYPARMERVKALLDQSQKERMANDSIKEAVEIEREGRASRYRTEFENPALRTKAMISLQEKALSLHQTSLAPGELEFYIGRMQSEGYSEEEVLLRYVKLARRAAEVLFPGKPLDRLTDEEKGVVGAHAGEAFRKFGVPESRREALEKRIGLTVTDAIERDFALLRERQELAKKIQSLFAARGRPLKEYEASSMAANIQGGGLEMKDVEGWVSLADVFRQKAQDLGIPLEGERWLEALFWSDAFKLGLARLPRSEIAPPRVDRSDLREAVLSQLKRVGADIPVTAVDGIVDQMIQRKIHPARLRLLVDRLFETEQQIKEAKARDEAKSSDDRTKTPRGTYDLNLDTVFASQPSAQAANRLGLLLALDKSNSNQKIHIGLDRVFAELAGFSVADFNDLVEKRLMRAVVTMQSHMMRDRLYEWMPKNLWQRYLSDFELWRYNERKSNGAFTFLPLLGIFVGAITGVWFLRFAYQRWKLRPSTKDSKETEEAKHEARPRWVEIFFYASNAAVAATFLVALVLGTNWTYTVWISELPVLAATWILYYFGFASPYVTSPSIAIGMKIRNWQHRRKTGRDLPLVKPHVHKSITAAKRFTDDTKTMTTSAFFLSGHRDPDPITGETGGIIEEDIPNLNVTIKDQAIPLLYEDFRRTNEAKAKGNGNAKQNLYFTLLLQIRSYSNKKKTDPTDAEFKKISESLEKYIDEALTPESLRTILKIPLTDEEAVKAAQAIRSRLVLFLRDRPIIKPFGHFLTQRWLMEPDEDYTRTEVGLNYDPNLGEANADPVVSEARLRAAQSDPLLQQEALVQALLDKDLRGELIKEASPLAGANRAYWESLSKKWKALDPNETAAGQDKARKILAGELQQNQNLHATLVQWSLGKPSLWVAVLKKHPNLLNPYMNGIRDIIGGDLNDPDDIRNLRDQNISKTAEERSNPIKATVVYDQGNKLDYDGLLTWAGTTLDTRNKNPRGDDIIIWRTRMTFNDFFATGHAFVMKWFAQYMLNHIQEAQYFVFGTLRAPGKYAYRSDDIYKRIIKTQAYERLFPPPSDLDASGKMRLKGEDEIMGNLAGTMGLADVDLTEDPMYDQYSETDRSETKWIPTFDVPQIVGMRWMPFVAKHPTLTAVLTGMVPAFFLLPILLSVAYGFVPGLENIMAHLASTLGVYALGGLMGWVIYGRDYQKISEAVRAQEARGIKKVPSLSLGHKFESNLMLFGLLGEMVWFTQLITMFDAMFFPGRIEILYPFPLEWALTATLVLMVVPKLIPAFKALLFGTRVPTRKDTFLGRDIDVPDAGKSLFGRMELRYGKIRDRLVRAQRSGAVGIKSLVLGHLRGMGVRDSAKASLSQVQGALNALLTDSRVPAVFLSDLAAQKAKELGRHFLSDKEMLEMGDLAVGQLSFDDAINELFVKARSDVSSLPPQDLRRLNHALLKFYFAKEEMRAPELIVRPLHAMAFVLLASAEMVSSNVVLMINIVKKPMMIAEKLKNQWLGMQRDLSPELGAAAAAAAWNPSVVGGQNPSFFTYLWRFRWPFAVGFSILSVTVFPYVLPYPVIAYITASVAFLLAVAYHMSYAKLGWVEIIEKSWTAGKNESQKISPTPSAWTILKSSAFRTSLREKLWRDKLVKGGQRRVLFSSIVLGTMVFGFGLASPFFNSVLPLGTIMRASSILFASFLFMPGWSWLQGVQTRNWFKGKMDNNRATYWGNQVVFIGTLLLGAVALAMFFVGAIHPEWVGQLLQGMPFIGVTPMADGSSVFGSYFMSLTEQVRSLWYFVAFFSAILFSGVGLGILATLTGFATSIYSAVVKPLWIWVTQKRSGTDPNDRSLVGLFGKNWVKRFTPAALLVAILTATSIGLVQWRAGGMENPMIIQRYENALRIHFPQLYKHLNPPPAPSTPSTPIPANPAGVTLNIPGGEGALLLPLLGVGAVVSRRRPPDQEIRSNPNGPSAKRPGLKAFMAALAVSAMLAATPVEADGMPPIVRGTATSQTQASPLDFSKSLYKGAVALRETGTPLVGNHNGSYGMTYTKPADVALDLLSTIVAARKGETSKMAAEKHIADVLRVLEPIRTYKGIFPEFIKIEDGIRAEVKRGRIFYSSLDSGWLTLVLSVIASEYQGTPLAARAQGLIDRQDYGFFDRKGLMAHRAIVDAQTGEFVEFTPYDYGDRASEARTVVLALVGLGKLSPAVWNNMRYRWTTREGVQISEGYHMSAFVEYMGNLFLDETALAPRTLGVSHSNYVIAAQKDAANYKHLFFGTGPTAPRSGDYREFGLDFNVVVAPYAAGLMNTTPTPITQDNLSRLLAVLPKDGRPAPSTIDPLNGKTINSNSLAWDHNILYLSLNTPIVRELIQKTKWHNFAADQLRQMDNDPRFLPLRDKKTDPATKPKPGKPYSLLEVPSVPLESIKTLPLVGMIGGWFSNTGRRWVDGVKGVGRFSKRIVSRGLTLFHGSIVGVRSRVTGGLKSMGAILIGLGRTGVALGSLAAEKIVKTPALLGTLMVGMVGLMSAVGVSNAGTLGSVGMGATGTASTVGIPVLFAMALSAVPAGAGSSAMFFHWDLPSFFQPLRRAGGFLSTPGIPSSEKKGDALVVDMRAGTLDPAVGKILLDRLSSMGLRSMDDPDGKLHIEFVVGNTPTAEEVAGLTKAFRAMAASSSLSKSAIDQITIGVVAQETEGLKARLTGLSAYHINVVAPASAVEFWSALGMPLTVFAAKFLNDLLKVEVDIVYTGAAAQAAAGLSKGALKVDEAGQVRLNALATPLEMLDQDKQIISLFNQQA